MMRASPRHTIKHRYLLGLFRSSHRRCSAKKGVLKNCKFHRKTPLLESLFHNVPGVQTSSFIKKILLHWCFPMKFAKFLRTPILKKVCERLLLFVSLQNAIANSGGEFGLEETMTQCKVFFKGNNFIQSNAAI